MRRPPGRSSSTETTTPAMRAKAMSSGACQPGASASRLNAAPLLKASTRLKKPVTARRSPGANAASTAHFVRKSATITAAARPNQRTALYMLARLARPVQVADAAPAQRLLVHVGAVVPAALALAVRAGRYRYLQISCGSLNAGGRGEHDVFQLLAQAREQLVVAAFG